MNLTRHTSPTHSREHEAGEKPAGNVIRELGQQVAGWESVPVPIRAINVDRRDDADCRHEETSLPETQHAGQTHRDESAEKSGGHVAEKFDADPRAEV